MSFNNKDKVFISIIKIYLCLYSLFIFGQIVFKDSGLSDGDASNIFNGLANMITILFLIGNILICLYQVIETRRYKKLFWLSICVVVFLLSIIMELSIIPLTFFSIIIFLFNLNLVKVTTFIKIDFLSRAISIVLVLLLCFLHIVPNVSAVTSHNGNSFRHTLGFFGPNELGLALLGLFISGFIFSKLLKNNNYIIFVGVFIFIYYLISKFSDSREFEIGGFLILLSMICVKSRIYNYVLKFMSYPSIIISICLFIYFVYFANTNSSLYISLNKISSDRLNIQSQVLNMFPPKAVGYSKSLIIDPLGNQINVDDLYASLLLHYGIIGLVIYEIIFISLPNLVSKINDKSVVTLLIVISICAFVSSYSSDLLGIFPIIYALYLNNN